MKLPLIILVLLVIIILAYVISGRLLRKKDGDLESIKSTPEIEDISDEEETHTRHIMTGSLKSTRNKMRISNDPEPDKKIDSPKRTKKKESTKKGEKRKYSPRKKKEDKGDDLLLS